MNHAWPLIPLGQVVSHRKEFIAIDDGATYKRCRVRLHAKGIVLRDVVSGADIKTKQQQVCRAGEFLVAEIDAKVGGFGLVPGELDGAIVSSHYFLFDISTAVLDPRFLDYFIRTPTFREQVSAQGSTNYAAVRPRDVLGYQIPLPPLEEQRRIVARIEALAAKVEEAQELRQAAVDRGEVAWRSTLRKAFTGQASAHQTLLEDVCTAIIDNLHSNPVYADAGVPCVRSPDVGWGTLNLSTALRTSEEEYRHRSIRGEPQPGDVVFVREGGGTGKAALVQEGQRFSLGQRVMMLRPNAHVVVPKFFLYQVISPVVFEDQIQSYTKGSASPHLNIGALRKFVLYVPPINEQQRIVVRLDCFHAEMDMVKRLQAETAAELEALLPSILDRAFKGEL